MDAILHPFVEDMMKLVSTTSRNKSYCVLSVYVTFLLCRNRDTPSVDGIPTDIYGALAVSAGNLGSLALGGFEESCTAYRCCRHYMATLDMARSKVDNLYSN